MKRQSFVKWQDYFKNAVKQNYPRWPNEAMVKLVFGNYLEDKIKIDAGHNVLDVGCGFGNNLLPFLDIGCKCFGTEVTPQVASQTQRILTERGLSVVVKPGNNTRLPFEDKFFDLVIAINVIHYEKSEEDVLKAFAEYSRVLKRGGRLVLSTVGPKHEIFERAQRLPGHKYRINNYDFRNNEQLFFFENKSFLKKCMKNYFSKIELGRVTEQLMRRKLDFLIAVGTLD